VDAHTVVHAEVMDTNTIIVGIDGSKNSVKALRWACTEAKVRDCPLAVLTCWSFEPALATGGIGMVYAMDPEVSRKAAEETLDEVIAQVTDELPTRPLIRLVRDGSPAHELIEASREGALLVIGARGHGGFLGLLLGSVANQVVHHSHCPVVVVRPPAA
jgi:nucleotide-binding universal stress UspA family protein